MNITSINHTSDTMPVNQSNQDSHEMNLQKQIVNLQGKMRDITYNNEMSNDEKDNEKKALQEKIKSLNSELKQYQLRKRRKEAEKREAAQKESEREQAEEARKTPENTPAITSDITAKDATVKEADNGQIKRTDALRPGISDPPAGTMVATANTKEHLANMRKTRTNLESRLRTAATDEEKAKLQKKLNNVSKNMGEKVQKISDTIADAQKEDNARKERVKKILKNFRDRMKNMNVSVPKSSKSSRTYDGDWDDNSPMPGKVLLTRKKS